MNKSKKRILIVEDSFVTQKAISCLVKSLGFEFDVAMDGDQAALKASRNNYALILMDLRLPGKDGLAVTREIRNQGNDAVVIAIGAYPLGVDWAECVAAGFDDFLYKGFGKGELESAMTIWAGAA